MSDQYESGAVGPVYRSAGAQDVLDQPQVLSRRHVPPAADPLQVAPGDQQRTADQEVPEGLSPAGEAVNHPVRRGKVDELGGLAHQLRPRVLAREHQVPDVVGAVSVVVVHLGQQLPVGRLYRGVQRRPERSAARHPYDPAGNRLRGRAPLDPGERRFVPVQRQHHLQPRIGLLGHRGERLRQPRRAPRRQQDRHVRQVGRDARPRRVAPQRRAPHFDAAQLARAGIEGVDVGGHLPMEFSAEQRPEPGVGVRRVHHYAGGGQTGQVAGPRDGIGVERRRVLHVVVAAQQERVAAPDGAVRPDAGRQPIERPQRRHPAAHLTRPVNRVVRPQIEGGRRFARHRAAARGAAPGPSRRRYLMRRRPRSPTAQRRSEPGAEDPPDRPALVERPQRGPMQRQQQRRFDSIATGAPDASRSTSIVHDRCRRGAPSSSRA